MSKPRRARNYLVQFFSAFPTANGNRNPVWVTAALQRSAVCRQMLLSLQHSNQVADITSEQMFLLQSEAQIVRCAI